MSSDLIYDGEYIVGGRMQASVTPNFLLREYAGGGKVRVARELAGAIQELRDSYGAPIRIVGMKRPTGYRTARAGTFAFLAAADMGELWLHAKAIVAQGYLRVARRKGRSLYVACVDPARPPPLNAESAFERAVRITAGYETTGDPYEQVTGNFDGAGLSFGPLQVNFKSGTLPQLFERFRMTDARLLASCFGTPEHWTQWQSIMLQSPAQQIAWAAANSAGRRKSGFAEPWRGYLQSVGRVEKFRRETLQYAYDIYGRRLIVAISWLSGLWGRRITDFRCLAALFDLCIQQGSLDKAHARIRARVKAENPTTQIALVRIAVEERGKLALPAWRADCVSRRLGILDREPRTVRLNGKTVTRQHPRIYLVRNTRVTGAEQYLT